VRYDEVGKLSADGVSALPATLVERLDRYRAVRSARFEGWLPYGGMLITTRFGETDQIHRVMAPMGMREQLTFHRERVTGAVVAPGEDPHYGFAYGREAGRDGLAQLHYFNLATHESRWLINGKHSRNTRALWSRDGGQLAWSSPARNGRDHHVWVRTPDGKSRTVVARGGRWLPLDFSPDAERLLVMKAVSDMETYPGEVVLATGHLEMFPVDGGSAAITSFRYGNGDGWVYYVSDEHSQFRSLRRHHPDTGKVEIISRDLPWDVTAFDLSPGNQHLAYITNEDGIGKLRVINLRDMGELALPEIPAGAISNLGFAPNGFDLALTLTDATAPADVYVLNIVDAKLVRWTQSEVAGLDHETLWIPRLLRYETFDQVDGTARTVPAYYYKPAGIGPAPVLIKLHGGSGSQALPTFDPALQFMVNELGMAVLLPNVRGSAGYGKDYRQLGNGRREEAVKDIGALLDWIATQPELDASRIGLSGDDDMVRSVLAAYGERIRASQASSDAQSAASMLFWQQHLLD